MSDPMTVVGSEAAKSLLGPFSDVAADAIGLIVGDRLANWRLKNVMRAHGKLRQEADRLGLQVRADRVPNRFAFAWFEEVSKQDDDELQTLFARLLAAAASEAADVDERLVRMLGQLTPADAKVFATFYETPVEGFLQNLFHARSMGHWQAVELRHFDYALKQIFGDGRDAEIEALERCGCLGHFMAVETRTFPERVSTRNIQATDWGKVIKDRTQMVEYLSHTELGRRLALAVLSNVAPIHR